MKKILLSKVSEYRNLILEKVLLDKNNYSRNELSLKKEDFKTASHHRFQFGFSSIGIKRTLNRFFNIVFPSLFIITFLTVFSSCNKIFTKKTVPKKEVIFYPGPPEQPRFQYLTKITTSRDIGAVRSAFS